jgi:hypothetical protein
MTTEASAGASSSAPAAGASEQNNGGAPSGESLLTEGSAAASPEGKGEGADGTKPESKEDKAGSETKGAEAPEKYEFKMPEGVELDGDAAAEFSSLAKELKLSQADAQRVADIAAKMQQKQAERTVETVKGWAEQSKADKEFGGDNLKQNLAVAQKAIDTFGSSELKSLLNSTGLGNHPELIRFAFKAGKAISEDGFVKAGARAATPAASLEKRLYPDMN